MFDRQDRKAQAARSKPRHDLTAMTTPTVLLAEAKRQALLEKIFQSSTLTAARFNNLCLSLLNNYINHSQQLPETANSYYALPGGLLDHALNRTEVALNIFHQQVVQQETDLSEEQQLWLYALFSAGILQGIGKLKLDYRIELFDKKSHFLHEWNPLLNNLASSGHYYHYEFQKEGADELRRRVNALLAFQLMPKDGFAWIANNPEVLNAWLALLHEDPNGAGVLGAILERADAIAIQHDIAEVLTKNTSISDARLNRVNTFIDRAPESTLEQDKLLGAQFIKWLTQALEKGTFRINKAPLLMIPAGIIMSAEVFQLFIRAHPEYKNWQMVQKGLMSWGLHKRYAGEPLVLKKYGAILPEKISLHNPTTGKNSTISTLEFIQKQQSGEQGPLKSLTTSGRWEQPKDHPASLKSGFLRGG